MHRAQTQVAVIGAGAAGLYTAVCAARHGVDVTLVSATPLAESSSYWAQGGLAAALAPDDSPARHLSDTIAAGRGCVRESAARVLCDEAPAVVADLAALGVRFDTDRRGGYALGLEGGHSARRVVHAGGAATGQRLVAHLSALVAEHDRIEVLERRRVTTIVTDGERARAVVLDGGDTIAGGAIVLATGGAAGMWLRTTNPRGAIGAGLLLAHAAGAQLADLELVQFHPTAVVGDNGADGLLVTEAIRGEGARLLDASGARFVDELAPRDEVAVAVQHAIEQTSAVGLDMREVDPALFPNVVDALHRAGIDPQHELIPVAPAAHYMMGGIATDLHGRATLPGLYAVGECSCTGLHGANRLASNSLTECFVFGARAARAAAAEQDPGSPPQINPTQTNHRLALTKPSREALWRHAGLERNAQGLRSLLADPHPLVRLIARSALAREESRGAHRRTDFPDRDPGFDGVHITLPQIGEPVRSLWY